MEPDSIMHLLVSAYQAAQYASTLGEINNQAKNMERNSFFFFKISLFGQM